MAWTSDRAGEPDPARRVLSAPDGGQALGAGVRAGLGPHGAARRRDRLRDAGRTGAAPGVPGTGLRPLPGDADRRRGRDAARARPAPGQGGGQGAPRQHRSGGVRRHGHPRHHRGQPHRHSPRGHRLGHRPPVAPARDFRAAAPVVRRGRHARHPSAVADRAGHRWRLRPDPVLVRQPLRVRADRCGRLARRIRRRRADAAVLEAADAGRPALPGGERAAHPAPGHLCRPPVHPGDRDLRDHQAERGRSRHAREHADRHRDGRHRARAELRDEPVRSDRGRPPGSTRPCSSPRTPPAE